MPWEAGEHPRLLFGASDLPALRRQAASGLRARIMARLCQVCDDYMDPAHPHYLDFREMRRDLWRRRHGIFTIVPALENLALAYAFTGKTAYGDCARDALMAIVEKGIADAPSLAWGEKSEGWRHGEGHDKGNFAMAVTWVYDFCYDRFTPEQRSRLCEYAKESIAIAHEWWQWDWWQIAKNHGIRGILSKMLYTIAFEGDAEIEKRDYWILDGEAALQYYLFLSYDAGGVPFEGPYYGGRLAWYALAAEILRRHGGPNLLTTNRFERMPEYLAYELMPGGWSINCLNDAHPGCGSIGGSLHLMGIKRGALIPWLATQLDLHPKRAVEWLKTPDPDQPADQGGTGINRAGIPYGLEVIPFLLWWQDDLPVRTPEELGYPTGHCFADCGLASMRTGWGPEDWLVSHFCGRHQYKCHRHSDFNHVSFYALGEEFLVDAGYGHPFGDPTKKMVRWFSCTDAHNCVLVDGADQWGTIVSSGWSEGEMLDWQHAEAFDTTLGDASSCTGPDHRVERALRRVVMMRAGPAPYLAVLDLNIKDGRPFEAEAHWHTTMKNRTEMDGRRFTIQGQSNNCLGEILWPPDAQVTLADSYGRPQVRVTVEQPVAEMLAVFCPRRPGDEIPRFSCEREAEGRFVLTCECGGKTSRLHINALLTEPLRRPVPVYLEA